MRQFKIHAQMRTDLYKVIDANTLEEAQEKAEDIALNGGMEEDRKGGDFLWDSHLDYEVKNISQATETK